MLLKSDFGVRILMSLLAFFGFWVAKHIYNHKKRDAKPLLCPAKFDCHGVVHSDYSKFLGLPLEIIGMLYYALVFFSYASGLFIYPIKFVITGAALFSVYLVFVQIFILKKTCLWCYLDALISILIFSLSVI